MKRMIFLLGAAAGAAATVVWLKSGGDIGQLKQKAKHAMSDVENEFDNVYPTE